MVSARSPWASKDGMPLKDGRMAYMSLPPCPAGGGRYFVKTALGRDESMFRGEALGLQAMGGGAAAGRGPGHS